MARAIGLTGDFYHRQDEIDRFIGRALSGSGFSYSSVSEPERFPWESLGDYDLMILAREGRVEPEKNPQNIWMTRDHEDRISRFVNDGGSLIVFHAGLASYPHEGPFFETVRGYFLMHPEPHPEFSVRPAGGNGAEFFAGMKPIVLRDEMYFVYADSSRSEVVLDLWSDDYGGSRAAWVHEAGRGRVFCFTPGHRPEVLENEDLVSAFRKGFEWCTS